LSTSQASKEEDIKYIGQGYAMEKYDLYYNGKKVGSASDSYKFLKFDYLKVGSTIYFKDKTVIMFPENFEVLKDGYAMALQKYGGGAYIYYNGEKCNDGSANQSRDTFF